MKLLLFLCLLVGIHSNSYPYEPYHQVIRNQNQRGKENCLLTCATRNRLPPPAHLPVQPAASRKYGTLLPICTRTGCIPFLLPADTPGSACSWSWMKPVFAMSLSGQETKCREPDTLSAFCFRFSRISL